MSCRKGPPVPVFLSVIAENGNDAEERSAMQATASISSSKSSDALAHIRTAIEPRLRSTGYHPLRNIRCEVVDGVIVLSGIVPSYFLKQLAQSVVFEIDSD